MLELLSGCGQGARPARALLDRTFILPLENTSGDPALDVWGVIIQHAVQTMASLRGTAPDEGVAMQGSAAAIARGVIERNPANDKVLVTLEIFDAASHKLLQSHHVEDASVFAAAAGLAKALDSAADTLQGKNPAVLQKWAAVVSATDPGKAVADCRDLLALDPAFGPAYLSCGRLPLLAADRNAFAESGYQNRKALKLDAQAAVGQMLFQNGKFGEAAEILAALAPTSPPAWNQVGYSRAMLGDIAGARKALEEYRKFGGDEPNAVDSLGEAHYIAGKYADAEMYFLECAEKFPQTVQGRVAKLKAACMRALRGNRAGGDQLAKAMIEDIRKSGQDVRALETAWREISAAQQDEKTIRAKIDSSGIISVPGRVP